MRVNDGVSGAILQTNRLEIDTPGVQPPANPPAGGNMVDLVFSNLPPNNVLGEPDSWIEIIYAGNRYAVPGYIF
jgi:hypothetical protein